jgi:phosphatidate cytidylyltransferase
MELVNPLVFPILQILAGATALSIVLSSIISILYRGEPDKVKNTWLKLWILLGLILVLIGMGSWGKWAFLPTALCLAYWGWLELLQCIEVKYGKILSSTAIAYLGTLGILGGLLGTTFTTFLGVIIAAWVAIALPMLLHRQPAAMYSVLGTAFGMIFITLPLANLLELVANSYGEFSLLILLVMGNDGFSQGFGLMGGKTPLMPNISPAKTWVGTGGGFLSCLVIGYLLRFLVPGWQIWQVILVAGIVSAVALCGDLIASSLKREAGIKDFGTVLAVTGGILDKFDSLLFAIPIFYFIAKYLDSNISL